MSSEREQLLRDWRDEEYRLRLRQPDMASWNEKDVEARKIWLDRMDLVQRTVRFLEGLPA